MMKKEWRDIKDWEGLYQINAFGQVKSLSRIFKGKLNFKKVSKERILNTGHNNYPMVNLCRQGKSTMCTVHRLLWETFVGKIPNGMQINHIDGNKHNNNLINLEVVTPSQNISHAYKTGLKYQYVGSKSPNSKLKEEQVIKIKEMLKDGLSTRKIAKAFSVNQMTISHINQGNTWSHLDKI